MTKRTKRIFDEIIYSSEKAAYLTQAEREAIEAMLVEKFGALKLIAPYLP